MLLWQASAIAATTRISDIRNTKHNFSATVLPNILGGGDTRTVKATSESEICVFCHTPHGANTTEGPLWNRDIPSNASYTRYSSGSIDSTINQPNGVSKLCLSCHDGTIAIGKVRNLRARFNGPNIAMTGTGTGGVMAPGAGGATDPNTGYTRNLGTNLTNDHPISMTYNQALVTKDMEMRDPTTAPIRVRGLTPKPGIQDIQLQPATPGTPTADTGQVQCISCHDPHIRDTTNENIKFLRLNRLQKNAPPTGSTTFNATNDIICLACHVKAGWAGSAHAQSSAANETYTNAAADAREIPRNTAVWQTACLTCHDTHAVQGSRRLLRDGTDAPTTTYLGYNIKRGTGNAAVEEVCFACHSPNHATLNGQGGPTFEVPDTYTDLQMAFHMPVQSAHQVGKTEVHNIGTANPEVTNTNGLGKDFIEDPNLMGRNNLNNRHAECTDCHNPHRVVKRQAFNQDNLNGADTEPTHLHTQPHTNIASGVLRGVWGVEPGIFGAGQSAYISASFHDDPNPSAFIVKRGDPGTNGSTAVTAPHLTREYQLCFKCHSNYAYPGGYNGPLALGAGTGYTTGTPSGRNGMTRYTNQVREFNSPAGHEGEYLNQNLGIEAGAGNDLQNHRSWHPVMRETSRTESARGLTTGPNLWLPPFRALGAQTMYCSDCHGTTTASGTVVPNGGPDGKPWGPHGSENNFILKGPWSGNRVSNTDGSGIAGTGTGAQDHLCFKCHDYAQYADPNNNGPLDSGFKLSAAGMGGGGMGGGGGGGMGGGGGGDGCMGGGAMCMGMMAGGMNNLHIFHSNQVSTFRCNLCHVAVPHGWKNKVFLVNLNDVGQEGGYATPQQRRYVGDGTPTVPCGGMGGGGMGGGGVTSCAPAYVNGPYYNRAALKVVSFAVSGSWQPGNCGSAGLPGNQATGVAWMAGSDEACNNLP
jgi:hypothetical protein